MQKWWRSWFNGDLPEVGPDERVSIPGIPSRETMAELERLRGMEFEERFLPVMIDHHEGAIEMSRQAWEKAVDPRVKLFAEQIRHAQTG